jgi:hypothetical protein
MLKLFESYIPHEQPKEKPVFVPDILLEAIKSGCKTINDAISFIKRRETQLLCILQGV